jgi:hypothetical protein
MVNLMQQAEAIRELRRNRAIQMFYEEVAAMALADALSECYFQLTGERLDETDALHLAQVAMENLPDQSWITIGSWFRSRRGNHRDLLNHEADAEILVYRLRDLGYL